LIIEILQQFPVLLFAVYLQKVTSQWFIIDQAEEFSQRQFTLQVEDYQIDLEKKNR